MKKYLCVFLMTICSLTFVACGNKDATFNGSRTGNDSQFIMDYTILNTTDSQLLELEAGDIIDVEVISNAGEVSIIIQKDGAEPIYESEDASTDTFQIAIEEGGTYKVTVTGEKAEGSVSFVKRAK